MFLVTYYEYFGDAWKGVDPYKAAVWRSFIVLIRHSNYSDAGYWFSISTSIMNNPGKWELFKMHFNEPFEKYFTF